MDIFLQQIINGLVQGSIYALVALGYTMVYGIMGLINFAHGEVVMIGTLVTITVASLLIKAGMPVALAGLAGLSSAVLVCMALGWGLERIAYRPLRNAPRLTPLITAIGMSIVLQNVAMIVWGRNYLTFPHLLPKMNFEFAGAHFTAIQVMIIVVSGLTMAGLVFLVYRTKLGMAMRATAQNPQVASLMGVNSNRVISAAFVIGSARWPASWSAPITKSRITRWASCSASRRSRRPCSAASATSPGRWPAASCSASSRRSGRATSAT